MTSLFLAPVLSSSYISRALRTATRLASVVLLLAFFNPDARGQAVAGRENVRPTPCATNLSFDSSNDMQSLRAFGAVVRKLFQQENFKELNCIADSERSSKERLTGGMWKLHEFYWAIKEMQGRPTQEDWDDHLRLARNWVAATPRSITARIVLARFYIDYAWDARGADTSDTVSDSGWKLLGQRLDMAKATLDEASALPIKCPEWYLAMQDIALGQDWDRARAEDLLRRAIAFEPDYYYYYRSYSYYLMPQWNGHDGDSAKFAEQAADHLGGDAGDILYFQIGEKIVCACNEPEFGHLSWPRLQKGYDLLEKKYGVSLANLNRLALMAANAVDSVAADGAFKRIGDNWDKSVWNAQEYFDQSKAWAAHMAPAELRSRGILQEAAANLQSTGGAEYQKNIEQALLPFMKECVQSANNDLEKFEIVVQVGKDGGPEDVWPRRVTATAQCVLRELYASHVKKETPFPPPPHPSYWLDLQLDPAIVGAAAAAN